MGHHYGMPIKVRRAKDGTPKSFTWHQATYRVEEILSTWQLADRWWVAPAVLAVGAEPRNQSDRTYWRLRVEGHQVFEIYHDRVSNLWALDTVQD